MKLPPRHGQTTGDRHAPMVIIGMHRSGTSLVARILEALGVRMGGYLAHSGAPREIFSVLPQVRLVVVLRHPIDRAYSGYCMQLARGAVPSDIEKSLNPDIAIDKSFLDQGLHASHLRRYLEFFPREQIHVCLFDDLNDETRLFLNRILGFLGIEAHLAPGEESSPANARPDSVHPVVLQKLLSRIERLSGVGPFLRRVRAVPFFTLVWNRLARSEVRYPILERSLRKRLIDYYCDDLKELETLLGRDLGSWRN